VKRVCKFAIAACAAPLAAAFAQPAPTPPAAPPAVNPVIPGISVGVGAPAPALPDSAAAAALFKDVKTAGATAPTPGEISGNTNTMHPIDSYVPVTDAMLRNPEPSDWLMMRGNYQGWGYSKLSQVNKSNVKGLQLVWARLMEPGINEATPIIYKAVMFLGNPNDVVQAIDAASGEILWQYRRRLPSLETMHNSNWGQRKRSIFLYDDKVYTTTRDNFLVALDAKTGKSIEAETITPPTQPVRSSSTAWCWPGQLARKHLSAAMSTPMTPRAASCCGATR